MRKYILVLTVLLVCYAVQSGENAFAQTRSVVADTVVYAGTPEEYRPYGNFENPYKNFFVDDLEYPGYGRHIPEPEHVETVKIGLISPIVGSVSESLGGPHDVTIRVNERKTRWDGYTYSHLAPIGINILQGAQLAVDQANAKGGYRGQIPYELVVRNDNGLWRSSGREVVQMAYKDSVWAIMGTIDGANSHILIRVALKAELPIMNVADTDPTFVETNIPWVFRNITDDRQMCYLLADFAFKKLGLQRIAAIRAVNRYGRMSIDEFRDAATRLGHPFSVEMSYEEGDTDFRRQLERIQDMNVGAVITYGNSRESAFILKQMREMGMNQWFFGSDRMVTQEFLDIVGENHGNVAAGYPYDPTSDDPVYLQFVDDFQNRYRETPETYAAHAYDGMNMILSAIEAGGLNRALIRDELVDIRDFAGVTGKKDMDAVFSNRSPAYLVLVKDGEFEYYSREEVFSDNIKP